ncbi:unnamed protein product, partial [Owenia fusiformis]
YGRRTCNRTRTCTCPTDAGDSQCVGASIQHKSEQCCRLKEEECPPKGDPGYGGNPLTSCCMDGKWYVPLGGGDYTVREVSDDKPIPMKCDPTFNFTISNYNNCRCLPPSGDEGTCEWTEWGEWKFSSCMQSDIQETDGTVVGSCPEYGRRTCNRTRTCTCSVNIGEKQCI